MLQPLPSSTVPPSNASASNVLQQATTGTGQDGAAPSSELRGGFARALEQATASEAPQAARRSDTTEADQAAPETRPREEPIRRQGTGKGTANRAASALKPEPVPVAPKLPLGDAPANLAPAVDVETPERTPRETAATELAPNAPVAAPESGGVGALLVQLQASAAAALQGGPATKTIAVTDTEVKAGPGQSDLPVTDGLGARRLVALTRSESTRLALGTNSIPAAKTGETGENGAWPTLSAPLPALGGAERPGTQALGAVQPSADTSQLLSTAAVAQGLPTNHTGTVLGSAGASSAMGEARLTASPGSPDFGPQLGAQITTFVRDGLEHAQLQLHPADMGPVLVQIQLDGLTAQVHLSAEHAVTRQALEDALPQLASHLREAGLTLSGGGVSEQAQQGRQTPSDNPSRNANPSASVPAAARESEPVLVRRGVVDLVA